MYQSKIKESIYPVGILWNMSSKYAREMMLKIAIMQDVVQVRVYDLKEKYEDFVLECYEGDEEAYSGGYIYDKIKHMSADNSRIVAFIFKIDNPTYRNDDNGNRQCVEARRIKQEIRDEYAPKIDEYFFDNLIHISDNEEEMRQNLRCIKQIQNIYNIKLYQKRLSTNN